MLRTALLGAGAVSVSVGLYIYAARVRQADFKNGPKVALRCNCGKFTGHVMVPEDKTVQAGLNIVCHCVDCVKWATKVVKHGGLTQLKGDEIFAVYRGTVHFDKPELIKTVRLYPHSNVQRAMTTCCETAIGGSGFGPVFMLSGGLVDPNEKATLLASLSPPMNIQLKQRKNEDPIMAMDPRAFETVPLSMIGKFALVILRGLVEMGSPAPIPPVDISKVQVIFPNEK